MSAATTNLPSLPSSLSPEGNLTRYLRRSASFRCSSRNRNSCSPSPGASTTTPRRPHQLVTSHLRLVAKIAMGYRGYGLPLSELISEGNVGMMQAVKRFDPDRGFRLATYAMWWIRAAIQEYILHSLVAREDGHHGGAEEAVLQPAQAEGPDAGDRGGRPVARARDQDRHQARRAGGGRRQHEPPPRQPRPLAQRAAARRQRGRMAGLAGRRQRQPGNPASASAEELGSAAPCWRRP